MITPNMLKVEQISAAPKKSMFERMSEAIQKAAAKVNKVIDKVNSAKSKLNKLVKRATNIKIGSSGIFSDILCCKLPSPKIRLGNFKGLNLSFRKLDLNFDTDFSLSICGKQFKANPFDAVMKVANVIKKNPGLLSPDRETRLNALLRSDLLAKANILGLGKTIPTCIFNKTIGSLYGSDYGLGPSLRSRNSLKTLLYQDPCTASLANVPLVNKWLSNSAAAALISTVISADKEKAYSFVTAALDIVGQRDSALGSLISSLAYAYDYNTRDKVKFASRVFANNKLYPKDFVSLKSDARLLFKQLDREKENNDPKVTDPNTSYKEIMSVLSVMDNTWNLDPDKLTPNYHKAAGNQTLKELSNAKLRTNLADLNLTGNYVTKLNSEHHIAIVNTFNCCTSCAKEVNIKKVRSGCATC